MTQVNSPNRLLYSALALGSLTDLLFYKQYLGISVPLFVLLLLGALFSLGRIERIQSATRNAWLAVPLLFFAAMIAVRANPTLTLFNALAVLMLLTLIIFFYASDRIERLGLLDYPAVLLRTFKNVIVRPAPPVATSLKSAATHREKWSMALPVLRGLLIALPLLALFTFLLSQADTFFAGFVDSLAHPDYLNDLPEIMWRLTLILLAAWLIAGALFYALTRHFPSSTRHATSNTQPLTPNTHHPSPNIIPAVVPNGIIGFVEGAVILSLVNVLFAVFAYFQFTYLFSGQAQATLHYEEFREYVRRGFGELLVVSLLSMALILGLRWAAHQETARERHLLSTLSSIMVGLTAVMLVSALYRMLVWEDVQFYINTGPRLYVRAFIVWLGVAFGWLLFTLWFRRDRFAIGAFLAGIGFLATINMLNPDADVAAYNLRRGDELSFRYLHQLSDDAIPALVAGLDTTTDRLIRNQIQIHLASRLYQMERDPTFHNWQSFHLARNRAHSLLKDLRASGKLTSPLSLQPPQTLLTTVPLAY